jgi:short-subunit dehydrogenase
MNAIITGASKGIGRAIAKMLASKGINLALCARGGSELIDLMKEIENQYPEPDIYISMVDVSKKDEIHRFVMEVNDHLGHVDILINNAGVFIPGEICNEGDELLETMIETNLYSAYYLTRAVVGNMIENRRGHIFNMCSVASLIAYPNGGSYSISKFALYGFNKVLREELKDKGIKVTAIIPGATWSDSWAGVDLPQERLMEADDIAKAVWVAIDTGPSAVIEEILMRPQLGDL